MHVLDNNAFTDFAKAWDLLLDKPDLEDMDLRGMSVDDALAITRAKVHLQGGASRGIRVACQYDVEFILVQGEYGYLTLRVTPYQEVIFEKSPSYVFDGKYDQAANKIDSLCASAMLAGEKLYTLIHWYDTVYRLTTGRQVSNNFDPFKNADKMHCMIKPGLVLMAKRREAERERNTLRINAMLPEPVVCD